MIFAQDATSSTHSDPDVVFLEEPPVMEPLPPQRDSDLSIDHEMPDASGHSEIADIGPAVPISILASKNAVHAPDRHLSDVSQHEANADWLMEVSLRHIQARLSSFIADRDSAEGRAALPKLDKTRLQIEKDQLEDRVNNQAKQLEVVQAEVVKAHGTISRLRQELEQARKDLNASRAVCQNQVQREIVLEYANGELRKKMAAIKTILRNDDADSADESSDEEEEDDADDLSTESGGPDQGEVSKDDQLDRSADDRGSNDDEQQVSNADFYDRVNDHTRQSSPPKPKNFKASLNAAGELEFVPCNGRARTAPYHHRRRQAKADSVLTLMGVNNVDQAQNPPA